MSPKQVSSQGYGLPIVTPREKNYQTPRENNLKFQASQVRTG